jgi:hypothetical protein
MTGEGISSLTSVRDKPRNDNTGFTEDLRLPRIKNSQ